MTPDDAPMTGAAWDGQMALPTLGDLALWVGFGGRMRRRLVEETEDLPGILLVIFFVPGLFGIMWYMLGCKPHQVVPS